MTERNIEEIKKSAEEVVDSFVDATEGLPELKETYYGQDTVNVFRSDEDPKSRDELDEFKEKFVKVMPKSDEDGNLEVEVAKWKK